MFLWWNERFPVPFARFPMGKKIPYSDFLCSLNTYSNINHIFKAISLFEISPIQTWAPTIDPKKKVLGFQS